MSKTATMQAPTATQRTILEALAAGQDLYEQTNTNGVTYLVNRNAGMTAQYTKIGRHAADALLTAGWITAPERGWLSKTYQISDAGRAVL